MHEQWSDPANILVSAAHLLTGAGFLILQMWRRPGSLALLLLLNAALLGLAALGLIFGQFPVDRLTLFGMLILSIVVNASFSWALRVNSVALFRTFVVSCLAGATALTTLGIAAPGAVSRSLRYFTGEAPAHPTLSPAVSRRFLQTSLYSLDVVYRPAVPTPGVQGGGLAVVGDELLLVTGAGDFYLVGDSAGGAVRVRPLPLRAPINTDEFDRDAPPPANRGWFRVAGLLADWDGITLRLFVSHLYWHADSGSYTVRISKAEGTYERLTRDPQRVAWTTIFESRPALKLSNGAGGFHFAGDGMGGRLQFMDRQTLLVTVGDLVFDGWNAKPILAQDPTTSYGKTLTIDVRGRGTAEVFSLGHRNPQGLLVDGSGEIWLTEHGPRGGDELNHLRKGRNYGWPFATFGTEYGMMTWPVGKAPEAHDGYEYPVYAWLPSIGVSNLIRVHHGVFPEWKGDLLVASLVGNTLTRLRLHDNRVVLAESMAIGRRIRDLVEDSQGRIVMWTDEGELVYVKPEEQESPRRQALASCFECHNIRTGVSGSSLGPDLHGIFERAIGTRRGFQYSAGLRRLRGKWSEANLRAFLRSPQRFAPGSSMAFPGVTDEARLDLIIEYLQSLK